jgi:hypothetical protein
MKKQLTQLLQKTYFYTHKGQDGIYGLVGSGTITVRRWVPFHDAYNQALKAIIDEAAVAYPERDFKPYFTSFKRIK